MRPRTVIIRTNLLVLSQRDNFAHLSLAWPAKDISHLTTGRGVPAWPNICRDHPTRCFLLATPAGISAASAAIIRVPRGTSAAVILVKEERMWSAGEM